MKKQMNTKMNDKMQRIGKIFIYFTLLFWLANEVLLCSTITRIWLWESETFNNAVSYMVLVLLIVHIVVFQQYDFKEIVAIFLISLPIIYSTIISSNKLMMSTWIFIVAAQYIDFEDFIKLAYYVQIVMILIVLFLFFSGRIEEIILYRGSTIRHSLGFVHPNQLGVRLFQLIICRGYLRRKRINIIDVGITIGVAVFAKMVPNSQTSFYALVLYALVLLFHIFVSITGLNVDNIIGYNIVVAVLVNAGSLWLSCIDVRNNNVLRTFDKLMSKRFSQCHRTLNFYGISLWGQDIQKIVKRHIIGSFHHFWLDNAYMTILLRYGVVVFMIFSFLYIAAMLYLKKEKQYMLLEIMCLYAIYGVMENNFYMMSQNLFLLVLSYPIYKHELKEDVIAPSKIRITI
jgi:hypothetical protein